MCAAPAKSTISDAPPRRLPVLLRHCWYGLNQAFRRRLAPLDLTPDQYTVLRNLSEKPGMTQRDLCNSMASDPNTVAALTARMEAEGWIERKTCQQDRRANRLRLLPPGGRKFAAADKVAMRLQTEVSNALDSRAHEALLESLSQLAGSCKAALRDSPPGPARRCTSSR
jgi:DNA-binding MarR family transcriptional regulator